MFLTKCGTLSDKVFENYLDRLVPRFFKIMGLKEDGCKTLNTYLRSFQSELVGSKNLINVLNDDPRFIILISTLQYFIDNDFDNVICKREVMKCINISKKLKSTYFSQEGDVNG